MAFKTRNVSACSTKKPASFPALVFLIYSAHKAKAVLEAGRDFALALQKIKKITIRLKRLKSQCMTVAGRRPLDWEHYGGLDFK